MKAIILALLGLFGIASVAAYAYVMPTTAATAVVRAIPLQQATSRAPTSAALDLFEIAPEESEARFVVDEVLLNAPKTVVGATDQVAGQMAVDPSRPENAQIGTILTNARTLATDSSQRDRAVQNQVLQTDQHEYISFTPTDVVALAGGVSPGQAMPFQIVGDLTIRGVTREVTFDATIVSPSADRLTGSATSTIRYADWGISIPKVPSVASVSDEVQLQLDFVATPA
jgi:polyisoprenoid-binding protein YceI